MKNQAVVWMYIRCNKSDCDCACPTPASFWPVQLLDAMSLEEAYQPVKQAALYEEALALVREDKVIFRSLRYAVEHTLTLVATARIYRM